MTERTCTVYREVKTLPCATEVDTEGYVRIRVTDHVLIGTGTFTLTDNHTVTVPVVPDTVTGLCVNIRRFVKLRM